MKIEAIRTLHGANVYSHQRVVVTHLDLEDLKGKRSTDVADFAERLLEILPALREHHCDRGRAGGFVERMEEGTHFNHAVEHAATELLALTGFAPRDVKICNGDEKDDSKAVIETTVVETTKFLMPAAAGIVEAAATRNEPVSVEELIAEAKEIAADTELGPSGRTIVNAAIRRGIPWSRENDSSLVQLGYGANTHFVQAALTDWTSSIAVDLAGDKDSTKQRLEKFSIPVPRGATVRTKQEAVAALGEIGAPVVVKPLDGRQGKGVSLNLSTDEEVIEAFHIAQNFSSDVLVEEMFPGKNYRVLVVGGKMAAASERVPCGVTGDGARTIDELVEIENENPLRGEGHEKPLSKIKITPIMIAAMSKSGWKLTDVPPAGEAVSLCGGMNLSTGGTARDVTDEVHPTVRGACERAARVVNLDICGVDLVLEDIAQPLAEQTGGVIELNAAPGLRMHVFPTEGAPRDVGGAIVEMLYPKGGDGRIPIIAVTGTNGKTTVTKMIAHILSGAKLTVGATTTGGIFIGGEQIVKGDTTGPVSAKTVLGDPLVEVAVLETARGGIVRRGLGYDFSDISVITNVSEDHIGQDGIESIEDLIRIKALVAERLRPGGTLIVNADDENSQRILEREKVKTVQKNVVYFSLDENNRRVREHLAHDGTGFFVRDGWIVEATDSFERTLLKVEHLPVTMNGAAEFQTANALAAIAACRAYGLTRGEIARLYSFRSDADNPGRSNLYRVGSGHVLIDYGHNAGAFAAVCRMAARWQGKRVTGIIGVPGDRDDRIIREAGRIAARGFHRVVIKEDVDLRGRGAGEVARLLCETVTVEAPDRRCDIVLDEIEAFEKCLEQMEKDEVVVLFYDRLEPVLEILERRNAVAVSSFETKRAAVSEAILL